MLEEDLEVKLTVVRDGNHSEEAVVLLTTSDGTALGIINVIMTVN